MLKSTRSGFYVISARAHHYDIISFFQGDILEVLNPSNMILHYTYQFINSSVAHLGDLRDLEDILGELDSTNMESDSRSTSPEAQQATARQSSYHNKYEAHLTN